MIRTIEELSLNAWPAMQTMLFDGWVLRSADGYTKRANSVYPLYDSKMDLDVKIGFCDSFYRDLGLPAVISKLASLPRGLVLVTGPTGSGKSTTLAAIIDEANKTRKDHIITVEDPIEFVHKNERCVVNHREVGIHTNSFASALRGALREDPDIILVGEMRDLETISLAIEAASTGHRSNTTAAASA